MVKYIKRIADNKYLQSIETHTWVDDLKDAFEMTFRECEDIKQILSNTYDLHEIIEILNPLKDKPITKEEKRELKNLFKNK